MTVSNPWSEYWSNGNLESCISTNHNDSEHISKTWRNLARNLRPKSQVLDLACGNGAVIKILLDSQPSLRITGIDLADIQQVHFAGRTGQYCAPIMMSNVSCEKLPFEDSSFDVLVSQFGLEYSNVQTSLKEIRRVGRKGAKLQFLMHHRDSAIIKSNTKKIPEIEALITEGGLLDNLRSYVLGDIPFTQLENKGREYLSGSFTRTEQVSGQVFSGINVIDELLKVNATQAKALFDNMLSKIRSESQRLAQLRNCALSKEDMHSFRDSAIESGFRRLDAKEIHTQLDDENLLIAWSVCGVL